MGRGTPFTTGQRSTDMTVTPSHTSSAHPGLRRIPRANSSAMNPRWNHGDCPASVVSGVAA